MAFVEATIKIPHVERSITTHMYFPTDLPESVGNKVKGVITLLHGMGNTGADWMMMSAAPRYAADNGYVLVAPSADNSFYNDMRFGSPFHTIFTQLLPAQLREIFKLPDEREKNFIAGLSMGGYGALRIGMACPEKYAAIGAFSGALDFAAMAEMGRHAPAVHGLLAPVLGNDLQLLPEEDLQYQARKLAELPRAEQPRILCTCGTQDTELGAIHAQNQGFKALAQSLPLDYEYREWDGVHEWNFWDRSLAEFIGFIQNDDYAERKRGDWAAPYAKV